MDISSEPPEQRDLLGKMLPFVNRFRSRMTPQILPFIDPSKRLQLYVVSSNARELSQTRAELSTFLGTARTNPITEINTTSDEVWEKILLDTFPNGFIRVSMLPQFGGTQRDWMQTLDTVNLYLELCDQRPPVRRGRNRSIGRVLRDFHAAIHNNDIDAIESLLSEAKSTGALSQTNVRYLELLYLAAARRWRDILEHPQIHDLIRSRIPAPVFEKLVESVVYRSLRTASLELSELSTIDISRLRHETEGISMLFTAAPRSDLKGYPPEIARTWAIGAAAHRNADWSVFVDGVLDVPWIRAIAAWSGVAARTEAPITDLPSADSEEEVINLIGRYAIAAPADQGRLRQTLAISEPLLTQVLSKNPYLRTSAERLGLTAALDEPILDSWNAVFLAILRGPKDSAILTTVQNCSRNWPLSELNQDELARALDEMLDHSDSSAIEQVRNVTPLLLDLLEPDAVQFTADTWLKFSLLLALDEASSLEDLTLAQRISEQFLSVTFAPGQYRDLVDYWGNIWSKLRSVNAMPRALDLVDTLVDFPIADSAQLLHLWQSIEQEALRNWDRLRLELTMPLRELAQIILGNVDHLPPVELHNEEVTSLPDLSGKCLAIYTLAEGAARRAQAILAGLFSGLQIELNHDHVATEGLKNLIKGADFFIFCAGTAKHAAFYAVTSERRDLIYPRGKGSSSIVSSFLQEIQA